MANLFDSPWKIMIVAIVIIVLFGSRKLPDAARSLGKSMRILKTEVQGMHEDDAPPANTGTGFPTQAQIQASQSQAAEPAAQADTQAQIDALQQQLNKLQSSVGADGTQAK
jgi:sec-independent protein translocase protein TatA